MANEPVSVVIPTYNRATVLKRALTSVLNQTVAPAEILVVDDGSIDDTRAVVRQFINASVPMRYIRISNSGVSHARNLGIRRAQHSWIALLDSDDEWLPNRLATQLELAAANPQYQLIHGEEIWVRQGKRVNPRHKHRKSGGHIFQRSLELCLISPSAALLRRELLDDVGWFDEDFVVCEDYDLWLRVTARHEIGFVTEPIIIKYGGHDDQLSAKYRAMDYWRVLAMDKVAHLENLAHEDRAALQQQLLQKASILLKGYAKHKNYAHWQQVQSLYKSYENRP